MYYFPNQAAILLGVRIKRLREHISKTGIGRYSHAPKRLMLGDKDLLRIWQDTALLAWMRKTDRQLKPVKPKQKQKYIYRYYYRYRPYKPIPAELQKPRGGARPGAGRPRSQHKTRVRGNPWAELLKKEGLL